MLTKNGACVEARVETLIFEGAWSYDVKTLRLRVDHLTLRFDHLRAAMVYGISCKSCNGICYML